MAFLLTGRVEEKTTRKGAQKKTFKQALKKDKRSSKKLCNSKKGKAKRQCKKGVNKNYRASVKNGVRNGKSVLNGVVKKIGHGIKSVGSNLVMTTLTGGASKILNGGKFFDGIKSTTIGKQGKSSPFSSLLTGRKQSPLTSTGGRNVVDDIFDLFRNGGNTNTSESNSKQQSKMDSFNEKLAQLWEGVKTYWYVPVSLVIVGLGYWVYKKFFSGKTTRKL